MPLFISNELTPCVAVDNKKFTNKNIKKRKKIKN